MTTMLWRSLAALFTRVALAAAYLSAVADRFGLWGAPGDPNVGWGNFEHFLAYTAMLNWYWPSSMIPLLGWTATIIEIVLAVLLLAGLFVREAALASGALLIIFAVSMTAALGAEPPLSYSVWTAAGASFLLAALPISEIGPSVDRSFRRGRRAT